MQYYVSSIKCLFNIYLIFNSIIILCTCPCFIVFYSEEYQAKMKKLASDNGNFTVNCCQLMYMYSKYGKIVLVTIN